MWIALFLLLGEMGLKIKTWNVPFSLLASVFSYRFSPLTAAQMIVSLRHGKQIVLGRSCSATELTELGYRGRPRDLGDG